MIHIDELFRQRMEDREASPRPGAWSNMRELLEKEMPVNPASTSWRRVFGYFTGLLLLASASVGGYSLYTGQLQSDAGTAPMAVRASNSTIATGVGSSVAAVAPITAKTGVQAPASQPAVPAAGAAQSPGRNNNSNSGRSTAQTAAVTSNARRAQTQSSPSSVPVLQSDKSISAAAAIAARSVDAASQPADPTAPTMTASAAASRHSRTVAPEVQPQAAAVSHSNAQRASSALPAELTALQSGLAASRPTQSLRVLDTIQRIEIVTRRFYAPGSRRPVYRLDTLPAEYVVVERILPVPAPAAEPAIAMETPSVSRKPRSMGHKTEPVTAGAVAGRPDIHAASPVIPAATLDAASREANATANEVAGRFSGSKLNFWQSLRLDERLANAKEGLQSIELYPGVIAGINATVLTPNALGGFQLGLSSLLAINEWWSVLGEVKYMYRFNTGSSVRDDYMSVKDVSSTAMTLNGKPHTRYDWKEAKVQHHFNYETVQTLEIPVMLRYNNNRFFTQGGVNFVSSRPIGAREVTVEPTEYAVGPGGAVPVGMTYSPVPANTEARIKMADFGNRFGIGYALGAGYSFTPAVYMDVRLTQTFWDNAKTEGARQISKDLLRNPSFQLSLGYRFGTTKQRD